MIEKNTENIIKEIDDSSSKTNIILIRWEGIPYESSVTYISKNISIMGYSKKEIIENSNILIKMRSENEMNRLIKGLKEVKDIEEADYESTYRATCKNGSVILVSEFTRVIRQESGELSGETVLVDTALGKELGKKIKDISDLPKYSDEDFELIYEIEKEVIDEIIDLNEVKKFMDVFCDFNNVISLAVNYNLDFVTETSGDTRNEKFLKESFGEEEYYKKAIESYNKTKENKKLSWLDTKYKNVKLVGTPLIVEGQVKAALIIYVILDEKEFEDGPVLVGDVSKIDSVNIKKALQLLDFISEKISMAVTNSVNYFIENLKREEAYKAVDSGIRKNETFAKIIQLMESDQEFESILYVLLETIGEYLNLSNAVLTKMNNKKFFDVIGEWHREGRPKYDDYEQNEPGETGEVDTSMIVISSGEEKGIFKRLMNYTNAEAYLTIPIMINSEPEMFASFFDDSIDRKWDIDTINFLADVCRMLQSIIYKRVSQNSLVSSYSALKEILNNIGSALYVVDKETKIILFCNELFKKLSEDDMLNKHCWDYHYGEFNEECKKCRILSRSSSFFEMHRTEKDEWYEVTNNDITWIDGKRVSLCVITDVTEKKKYQSKIEFQANNDFLTGLYNRRRCEEDISLCIKEAEESQSSGAIMFIDLDDFKHINDGLGHQYGDILLRMVSNGLQQIEGVDGNCYRLGGDEFLILVRPEHYEKLEIILAQVQDLFSKPWYLNDTEYYCTMSMGVICFPRDGSDVNDLIKKADIAMYDAKNAGKNRYRFYDSGEEKLNYERLDIEKNMRLAVALGCDEFEIYIQPIFDLKTRSCVGGESLIRWNSLNLGFLHPGEFIPLAEHLGLIVQIGEYVLEKACEINKCWSDMGYEMKINVNLSVIQLLQNDIVEVIGNIVKKSGINPSHLVLEVTENYAINDLTRMAKIINSIKELGVKVALDDFGTGYSSLNYIKQLNFDTIKVDRAFIRDITSDSYSRSFVRLISELSKELNINLCVEGVETKKQFNILKEMNVELVQGYYFGKPMPLEKFEKKFLK